MNSSRYFEMKIGIGAQAAVPFYVSPSIDITSVVVQTLNKNFPAPGPVASATPPVTPAGGTAPAPAAAPRP